MAFPIRRDTADSSASACRAYHTKKQRQSLGKPLFYWKNKKRETGFEPATLALARRYSTTEPLAHIIENL